MFAALSGLLVETAHVAIGPDHLAAVAPLAIDSRRRHPAALVGATWGLGHGLGVLVIGLLGQVLKTGLSVDLVSTWAEPLVGVLLIGLGAWTLRRARRIVIHDHSHRLWRAKARFSSDDSSSIARPIAGANVNEAQRVLPRRHQAHPSPRP